LLLLRIVSLYFVQKQRKGRKVEGGIGQEGVKVRVRRGEVRKEGRRGGRVMEEERRDGRVMEEERRGGRVMEKE